MSGIGKTTAALTLAHRYDLRLYTVDARTYEHAAKMPAETRTLDEIWVETTPEILADWFESGSRERFRLILEDLERIEDDAPVLVEGPQVLPDLVAPLLSSPDRASYVVARPELQRQLVQARGPGVASRTSDPARALANRLGRDEVLTQRLRAGATEHGLTLVEVDRVEDTLPAVESRLLPRLEDWLAQPHGDVSARRREENDIRLRQWRSHVDAAGIENPGEAELACECDQPGCDSPVLIGLRGAEASRRSAEPLLSSAH
jgi:cytidylate kinase